MEVVGTSSLGLALLAIGGWMLFRKKSRKIVTWLWLAAGFSLSGGLVATLGTVFGQVGGAGAKAFGVTTSVFMSVAGVIAFLEIWHGAHPKNGTPKTHHPILALLAPILIGAGGGGLLHQLTMNISQVMGGAGSPLSAFFGG